MLFKVFSPVKQKELSAFLGVLDLVVYSLLVVDEALSSVEFEYSVWVCDEYIEVWKGRVFSRW